MGIQVNTDFPGGNANVLDIQYDTQGEEIRFAAESKRGEPKPLWFHFSIQGARGPRIRCVLTNAALCLGDINGWVTNAPVYRIGEGEWQRVSSVQLQENEHLVTEAVFDIYTTAERVEVAFCYPYQFSHLEKTLRNQNVWKKGIIGHSSGNNQLIRLYNDLGDENRTKPGIYLLARQHSGETPGSFVMDGVLRYLSSEAGRKACEDMCWWMNPFVDIDGVLDGSYGKDQAAGDLNRAWGVPYPTRPEVRATQIDMYKWMSRTKPVAVIDLHAPSHPEHGFYFHLPNASRPMVAQLKQFADDLQFRVPDSLRGNLSYTYNRATRTSSQTGDKALDFALNEIGYLAATLEIAYQGPRAGEYYTVEDYHTIGAALVEILHELALRRH